jgi:hypothetical protein
MAGNSATEELEYGNLETSLLRVRTVFRDLLCRTRF